MKRMLRVFVTPVVLVGISACTYYVGFDKDPNQKPITNGENISTVYQNYSQTGGVTFGCFNGPGDQNECDDGQNAYAVTFGNIPPPPTPPNVFAIGVPPHYDSGFTDQNGGGWAKVWPIAEEVSIWAYPIPQSDPYTLPFCSITYIQAFDSNGNQIGQTSWKPQGIDLNKWHQIIFTSTQPNIASVKFTTTNLSGAVQIFSQFNQICWSPLSTAAGNLWGCAPS